MQEAREREHADRYERERHESVQDYYGKELKSSRDLKTSACTASGQPHPIIRKILRLIPDEVLDKFYGCGAPIPLGIKGLRVLDLGSGSGRDCYVCAALVGESGFVTGIDMTDEQIEVAERHVLEFSHRLDFEEEDRNMRFVKGHIEHLDRAGIKDSSIDLVISNCVVNLSPDKRRVLSEAYRVLTSGGEFHFSDVFSDRRVPFEAQKDKVMWGECLAGALYIEDFITMAKAEGFLDPRILSVSPMTVHDQRMRRLLGDTSFYSVTFRLFKLPELLKPECQDHGQVAFYKGTIEGHEQSYTFDHSHTFEKNRPYPVCLNTAAMLGRLGFSWLTKHFEIKEGLDVHNVKCGPTPSLERLAARPTPPGACRPRAGSGCC